ncbi:MAG: flagellar hook-basal body complex protein FliE [Fimbriimonadales bacterium]|nr:flagellar hook-basal body complex protein FliE [Fimbriimonadales bacterium]
MRIEGLNLFKALSRPEMHEVEPPKLLEPEAVELGTPEADFSKMLREVIGQVSEAQQRAGELAQRFAAGEPVDEHTLVLAMERANLAFQLTLHVRNKVLEAYQEIMRLQV